jgi:hypothetical protein
LALPGRQFCDRSASADQEDTQWPDGRRVRRLLNGDSRSAGQHPSAVLAGKAKHQQPAQIDRRNPHRPLQLVALDATVGHPPAAVGGRPGKRAFHHRPPAPVALLEAARSGAARRSATRAWSAPKAPAAPRAGITRHLLEAGIQVVEVDRPDRTARRRHCGLQQARYRAPFIGSIAATTVPPRSVVGGPGPATCRRPALRW